MIEVKFERSDYGYAKEPAIKFIIEGLTYEKLEAFAKTFKQYFCAEDEIEVDVPTNKFREKNISRGPSFDEVRYKNKEFDFKSFITRSEEMNVLFAIMEQHGFEGLAQIKLSSREYLNWLNSERSKGLKM